MMRQHCSSRQRNTARECEHYQDSAKIILHDHAEASEWKACLLMTQHMSPHFDAIQRKLYGRIEFR